MSQTEAQTLRPAPQPGRFMPAPPSRARGGLSLICTVNLALIIGGYQFITLFMPDIAAESQTISIPYRIIAAAFCVTAIVLGYRAGPVRPPRSGKIMLLLAGCLLYGLRMVSDILFVAPYDSASNTKAIYFVTYSVLCCLFAYVCLPYIKLRLAAILSLALLSASVVPAVLKGTLGIGVGAYDIYRDTAGRMAGNVGFFAIAFGYAGAAICLIATHLLITLRTKRSVWLVIYAGLVALGLAALMLSGSRSPFLAGAAVLLVWMTMRIKEPGLLLPILVVGALFYGALNGFDLGGSFSHSSVTRARLMDAYEYHDGSGRFELVAAGMKHWLQHPLLGGSTYTALTDSMTGYHSAIVDGFAYLGVFGGVLVLAVCVFGTVQSVRLLVRFRGNDSGWVALICLLYTIYNAIFGAGFYEKYDWITLLAMVFMIAGHRSSNSGPGASVRRTPSQAKLRRNMVVSPLSSQ